MANGILFAGLVLIFIATEMTLRGAVGLARQFDVPPLYTGIFVISILTVVPELFVTFEAASSGHSEMALGGLIGANLLNLLLIMGLGALIHPMAAPPKVLFRDGGVLLLGALGLVFDAWFGGLTRLAGLVGVVACAGYIGVMVVTDWRRSPDHSVPLARALFRSEGAMPSVTGSFFLLLLGLIALGLGSHLSIVGGAHLAVQWGFPEVTIGLTLLAAGLSSPKLLVTLVSAVRGQTTIAVGQLLAASALNVTLVIGLVGLFHPFAMPQTMLTADIVVLAVVSLVILPLLAMRWRLSRPRGTLLIIAYGCYLGYLLMRQGLPLPWGA